MSASYWIAKYVEDPFRNETRNVGVIVSANNGVAAKFVGERDDGVFDARKLKGFTYPSVYSQWRDFWRTKILAQNIDAVVAASTPNFYVAAGGEVTDIGSDRAADVCHFLYGLLVGRGVIEAFEWDAADDSDLDLSSEITAAFNDSAILQNGQSLFSIHPVITGEKVLGKHVTHTPSYSQRNGSLYIMEHIDLSTTRTNKAKERAGWMAYMFADIRDFDPGAQAYSLVRPERENAGEQIEYAKSVLEGESKIINWSDPRQRDEFLNERKVIAGRMPPTSALNLFG